MIRHRPFDAPVAIWDTRAGACRTLVYVVPVVFFVPEGPRPGLT